MNIMIPTVMKAIEVTQTGGPEQLTYCEVPVPSVGPDQILLKSAVAGVNFFDTYVRSGVYDATLPLRPGIDGAGVIAAVGQKITHFSVGQSVAYWGNLSGGYAEYVLLAPEHTLAGPADTDLQLLGALPTQGLTAHMLIDGTYPVGAGTEVFITAGAGGVGNLAIQLARARGARVITSVSTKEKAELAYAAGADHVIFYRDLSTEELSTQIRQATDDGQGVHVAFDGVGQATFEASLAALRPRGTLVLFGGASGQVPPFDIQRLNTAGSLFLTRPSLNPYMASAAERKHRWDSVAGAVANGELKLNIGATFPLAEASKAHELIESGTSTGKILLEF